MEGSWDAGVRVSTEHCEVFLQGAVVSSRYIDMTTINGGTTARNLKDNLGPEEHGTISTVNPRSAPPTDPSLERKHTRDLVINT